MCKSQGCLGLWLEMVILLWVMLTQLNGRRGVCIALHEKMGMNKVAHFPNVGFKFCKWLDVGYWQSNLHN
jgi:L-amino acid N-acyltransferase YncA